MTQPWHTVDRASTREGVLELRRRGDRDYLIVLDGRVLMNSAAHRSEATLGALACQPLRRRRAPRVLLGGLGMGFTLRAALDILPADGRAVVAELEPVVVDWCRGPLAPLTHAAVDDPRVTVVVADVATLIRGAAAAGREQHFDAVVLDLFQGPGADSDRRDDPLYGSRAIETTVAALKPGGLFAVWGEQHDPGFEKRLRRAGFSVSHHRPGHGGLRHAVYLARKVPDRTPTPAGRLPRRRRRRPRIGPPR